MSLPESLEKLLRAAYEAGARGDGARTKLEQAMERIERFDVPQKGAYGQASKDAIHSMRRALDSCPQCGHAPHGSWCANMASDNDCNCTYDPAAEFIADLDVGDKLSAIADLDDVTSRDLPSLQVGTTVDFVEGSFVVQAYSRSMDAYAQVELVDKSAYLEVRTIAPNPDPTHGRIDQDIQKYVDRMNPSSLGQRVAMETTLQEKRDREEEVQRVIDTTPETMHYATTARTIGKNPPTPFCGSRDTRITTAPGRVTCDDCRNLIAEPPTMAMPDEACEECLGPRDDKDIDVLGYKRYGRHLCVKCYLDEVGK